MFKVEWGFSIRVLLKERVQIEYSKTKDLSGNIEENLELRKANKKVSQRELKKDVRSAIK